ncbi:PREDICTED: ADP-ribosylation factor-binding protein GGA3-like isoform X1 [Branchiostoma belcheri]|uniref:ADP-ribosylation factor-binding protein GGA3-like isoform X1 n=1 Tax=Branchiostoma belcheri TaxID=7741 RepID=A0A6P4YFD5_BRABE|nr:PREDICTED: ADP-ribosylation factor-binding protein GGA3-like isoform X1 [Branchiostoma belcheri]
MAASDDGETLETWLNKATSPANRQEDWEYIMGFCDQVNKELEGPQIATRLISHKIQSPQEMEAMQALTVLEACVKNCGRRFHQEIGKFRFLNEMIKLVSPKYLGSKTKPKVKTRVIELLYSWSKGLPHETKVQDAYQMLKKQGIVTEDPKVEDVYEPPPPPRPRNTLFEDEDKAKLLDRLLKSKHPEDLQAANRLIKNMVKEDSDRMERVSRRMNQLEEVNNNVRLLNEMLAHYKPNEASDSEKEVMKELYAQCEKMRPNLFRLASDTPEGDDGIDAKAQSEGSASSSSSALADILRANDDLMRVMQSYQRLVEGVRNGTAEDTAGGEGKQTEQQSGLADLLMLDAGGPRSPTATTTTSAIPPVLPAPPTVSGTAPVAAPQPPTTADLLSSELQGLGLGEAAPASAQTGVLGQPTGAPGQPLVGGIPFMPAPGVGMQPHPVAPASNYSAFGQAPPANVPMSMPGAPPTTMMAPMGSQPPFTAASSGVFQQNTMAMPMATATPTAMMNTVPTPGLVQPQSSTGLLGDLGVQGQTQGQGQGQEKPAVVEGAFSDLDVLGKSLQERGLKPSVQASQPVSEPPKQSLNQLLAQKQQPGSPAPGGEAAPPVPTPQVAGPGAPSPQPASPATAEVLSLQDVFVPIESVQPGSVGPLTICQKDNMQIVLHFARDTAPGRPDVHVMVVSITSNATERIQSIVFQAAVPKVMRVKLQPPSATDLPGYNPILPQAAITQVMLLANPNKVPVRLKYKLSYMCNEQQRTAVGEVSNFPNL